MRALTLVRESLSEDHLRARTPIAIQIGSRHGTNPEQAVMTPPLDFADLVSTLIVAWACALVIPFGQVVITRYRGRLPARPMLLAAVQYLCFGSMFTIFGIAQKAKFLGFISYRLYIFTIFAVALSVGCAGLAGCLQAKP
jgi:hypothetical protein